MPKPQNTPVTVSAVYDHTRRKVEIAVLIYEGRAFDIDRVTYQYKKKRGNTLFHIFTVTAGARYFQLELDTDQLNWVLLETRHAEFD